MNRCKQNANSLCATIDLMSQSGPAPIQWNAGPAEESVWATNTACCHSSISAVCFRAGKQTLTSDLQ